MKYLIPLLAFVLIAACEPTQKEVFCTEEAKLCPDGTAVGRVPPNCEFAPCPEPPPESETPGCDYDDPNKPYTFRTVDECARAIIDCVPGYEYFIDSCGCGCKLTADGTEQHPCPPESREAAACIALYQPVCGWMEVQCKTAPCPLQPQTFSNSCVACMNARVQYWTDGECPS